MMWEESYGKLSTRDGEEFTRLVNILLSETFIISEKLYENEKIVKINNDYRFIERHFELFEEYLKVAGWELNKDNNYGVISIKNKFGMNRIRLDKNTTNTLYILRLIYEEERGKLTLIKEVITSIGDIVGRMASIGLIKKKMPDKDITSVFSFFKNYNIIDKTGGKWTEPETQVIIYPSILFIITNEKINSIFEMLTVSEDEGEEESPDETS
jgi:hypothetical protein